jgi:hypothetical protein
LRLHVAAPFVSTTSAGVRLPVEVMAFITALLIATLTVALQQQLQSPGNPPARIVIVPEVSEEDPSYVPQRDQSKLQTPARWCATPRRPEPLVQDARRAASSRDGLFELGLYPAGSPDVAAKSIRLISDERLCEVAARHYDALKFGGGSISKDDHPAIHPVVVVAAGNVYLVDDATDRTVFYLVVGFDHAWNEIGSYGVGL